MLFFCDLAEINIHCDLDIITGELLLRPFQDILIDQMSVRSIEANDYIEADGFLCLVKIEGMHLDDVRILLCYLSSILAALVLSCYLFFFTNVRCHAKVMVSQPAIKIYHRPGGLNNRNLFLIVLETGKSMIKVTAS